jgi:hypothetical protein
MTVRRWTRWVAAAAAFFGLPLLVAAVRLREFDRGQHPPLQPPLPQDNSIAAAPPHDTAKPTVAVILGADLTEITDALGPYEMFSRAKVITSAGLTSGIDASLRVLTKFAGEDIARREVVASSTIRTSISPWIRW